MRLKVKIDDLTEKITFFESSQKLDMTLEPSDGNKQSMNQSMTMGQISKIPMLVENS